MSPSTLLLSLSVLVGMPGGGKAGSLAQPLADEQLGAGTVSVLIREGPKGLAGIAVIAMPASAAGKSGPVDANKALASSKTDAQGRVYLKLAAHQGQQVRILARLKSKLRRSVAFAVPAQGGVRFLFMSDDAGHGGGKGGLPAGHSADDGHNHGHAGGQPPAPKGPSTRDPSKLKLWLSFRMMAIEKETAYWAISYTIYNKGTKAFDPGDHGLPLPVPSGAKSLALPRGTRGASVGKRGIISQLPVPLGRHGVRITATFNYPVDESTRRIAMSSPLPIVGYAFSFPKNYDLEVDSSDLGAPQTRAGGRNKRKVQVYRSVKQGFPTQSISFTVKNLPVRKRPLSTFFLALAMLLVLGGLGTTLAMRRRKKADPTGRKSSAVDQLVALERDVALGLISNDEAEKRAAKIAGS